MVEELIKNDDVLNIYEYGSRVYGTHHKGSDLDYIVIVKDTCEIDKEIVDEKGNNYNIYRFGEWKMMLEQNHIVTLECMSLSEDLVLKERKRFIQEIGIVELRKSVSRVVSNSYVKSKKKMAQGDTYVGKKSLWHSLRILMFGIQCVECGKIVDYTVANKYYDEIVKGDHSWEQLEIKWKPIMKELKKEFQMLTAEDWGKYKRGKKNVRKNK